MHTTDNIVKGGQSSLATRERGGSAYTHLGRQDHSWIGSPAQKELHSGDIALQDRQTQCLVEEMLLHRGRV